MSIFNRKQTVEIDYDKLANAILKAQQKADTQTIKNAIIEANEEIEIGKKKHTYSGELMSFLATPITASFTAIGISFIVGLISYLVKKWTTIVKTIEDGVAVVLVSILLLVIAISFTFVSWKSSEELRKTNDTQLTSTVLSSLTSYMAMIVSIVALLITIKKLRCVLYL